MYLVSVGYLHAACTLCVSEISLTISETETWETTLRSGHTVIFSIYVGELPFPSFSIRTSAARISRKLCFFEPLPTAAMFSYNSGWRGCAKAEANVS